MTMKGILDGSNPTADAKLMQAVADANEQPDAFDGGCPADVEPRTSYQAAVMADANSLRKTLSNGHDLSERIGVKSAIIWLMSNGYMQAGEKLSDAYERGEVLE
jgi:hypothetical protein